ncbi:MAG: hypothetical protein OEX02_20885 [Cyclobacteriaceae bacterium]|nr:hypothetical protein [Cyclobacteriaceae bacterium]
MLLLNIFLSLTAHASAYHEKTFHINLGKVSLDSGRNELIFLIKGANQLIKDNYIVGLDYIELKQ